MKPFGSFILHSIKPANEDAIITHIQKEASVRMRDYTRMYWKQWKNFFFEELFTEKSKGDLKKIKETMIGVWKKVGDPIVNASVTDLQKASKEASQRKKQRRRGRPASQQPHQKAPK